MQGTTIFAAPEIVVCFLRLLHRQIFGERNDAQEFWPVTLQSAEIHPGKFYG